jgi:23S rRNA pseudouridine1911/1915/1917 synthase
VPEYRHTVPKGVSGQRMDAYSASVFETLVSRSQARKAIKAGLLLRNAEEVGTGHFVHPDDQLVLSVSSVPKMPLLELELEVPFLDEWMAVVYKPAGIHVRGNRARTVHRALRYNFGVSAAMGALGDPDPVHRLDKRTQGLLMVARTAGARQALGDAFKERRIRKRYRAILTGRLEGGGVIETPIEGRNARTEWHVVGNARSLHTEWLTTVDLRPITGRTHQLRRHMTELGHPVLGDDLHSLGPVLRGSGLFLAAVELKFDHPVLGTPVHVAVPEPERFERFRAREERRWTRWNNLERA